MAKAFAELGCVSLAFDVLRNLELFKPIVSFHLKWETLMNIYDVPVCANSIEHRKLRKYRPRPDQLHGPRCSSRLHFRNALWCPVPFSNGMYEFHLCQQWHPQEKHQFSSRMEVGPELHTIGKCFSCTISCPSSSHLGVGRISNFGTTVAILDDSVT